MSQWTDERKEQAIQMYNDAEPTGETSVEICKDIADAMGESPNGVRMILSKAGVYIAKTPAVKSGSATASGDKPARVSKEAAHAKLVAALEAKNSNVDEEIISKLTGKAALYFAALFEAI